MKGFQKYEKRYSYVCSGFFKVEVTKDTKNDKLPLMDCTLNNTFLLTFETLV